MLGLRENTEFYPKKVNTEVAKDGGFDLLSSMSRMDGLQLMNLRERFDKRFDELKHLDRNFMLQDFIGDYFYEVHFDDDSTNIYCKGEEAYDNYMRHGTKLVQKSKDLFPTYKTLMEKGKEYKNKTLSKADYDREYDKQNRKQVKFVLNKNTDDDIIEYLDGIENKNKYLKELIRKDMESKGD